MISLSAKRAFKAYHFEVPHNLSKNVIFLPGTNFCPLNHLAYEKRPNPTDLILQLKPIRNSGRIHYEPHFHIFYR